jgi:2-isopropylmalate synthase
MNSAECTHASDDGESERVNLVTSASGDVLAAAYVELEVDGQTLWGVGIDGDISTASLKAIVSAVNRSVRARTSV